MVGRMNLDTIPFPNDGFIVAAEIITPTMITGAEEEEEVDDVSSDQFNGGSGLFIRSLPGRVAVGGDNAV